MNLPYIEYLFIRYSYKRIGFECPVRKNRSPGKASGRKISEGVQRPQNESNLRHVGFVERAVISHEDADPVAHLHADLIVGEEGTVGLAIGDDDLGQHAKALAKDDAGRKARVGKSRPVVGIGELGAGDDVTHLTALHVLREDAGLVGK